ncbi:MAG: transporter substrate-binding domain-containing protein [Selenomonadaceae bacterium]|nr:transporter substrate-binding domain-containing protein [Selenomonadaceae bacterium]
MMKKLTKKFSLLLLILMILSMISGCGDNAAEKIKNSIKIGMIAQLNTTPEQMDAVMEVMGVDTEMTYYDNFTSMQMALSSKNIDEVQTYKSVAKYMTAQNSQFEMKKEQTVSLIDSFCCAMREEDVNLKNEFDSAITAMKSDGTLENLIKTYITELDGEPPAVEITNINGAEIIKVGITGDLPPLDLVLANGQPAGFNTAVLSEISKRINKNIELIQIDSAARAAALTSKQVDVVFWVVVPQDDKRPADMDKPAGVSVTSSYYQDEVVNVNLSSLATGMN